MKGFWDNMWKNRAHIVMALPVFLVLLFIMYLPMSGLVMAFKNFNYAQGIFGSPWAGLDNFKNAFTSVYESRYVSGVVAGLKIAKINEKGELKARGYDREGKPRR